MGCFNNTNTGFHPTSSALEELDAAQFLSQMSVTVEADNQGYAPSPAVRVRMSNQGL